MKNLFLKNERWAFLAAGTMISAIVLVPWARGMLPSDYTQGEMITQWVPFRVFMAHCWGRGVFPLWDPYIFGGMPFWAYTHTMSAYPVMALSLLLPLVSGNNVFYVFHIYLMCWGFHRLLRRVGLDPLLAFAGTVMMGAGGWAMVSRDFYIALASASWLPVLIYLAIRVLDAGTLRAFASFALALALQFMVGDAEGSTYTLFFMTMFIVLAGPGFTPSLRQGRPALYLGAGVLAVVMAAVMWIPLMEYYPHCVRNHGITFDLYAQPAAIAARHWYDYMYLISSPTVLKNPLKLTVLFFIFYHLAHRRPRSWAIFACILLAALVSDRQSLPVEKIFFHLPLMGRFLRRVDVGAGMIFFAQWLALLGVRDFIQSLQSSPRRPAALVLTTLAAIDAAGNLNLTSNPAALLPALAAALFLVEDLRIKDRAAAARRLSLLVAAVIILANYVPLALSGEQSDASDLRSPEINRAFSMMDRSYRHLIAANLTVSAPYLSTQMGMEHGAAEVFGWNRVPPRRYLDLIALIDPTLIGYDHGRLASMQFVFDHMNGSLLRSQELNLVELLSVRYLFDQGVPVKWTSPQYASWLIPLPELKGHLIPGHWRDLKNLDAPLRFFTTPGPRAELAFSVAAAAGADAAAGGRLRVTIGGREAVDRKITLAPRSGGGLGSAPVTLSLAGAAGMRVEIVISFAPAAGVRSDVFRFQDLRILEPDMPYQLTYSPPEFDLYENPAALPMAFLAGRALLLSGRDRILDRLKLMDRDELASTVILSDGPEAGKLASWTASAPSSPGAGSVIEEPGTPGRRVFDLDSSGRSWFFLSQNHLPGWTAALDGLQVPLLDGDWAFTTTAVGPGRHRLALQYRPWAFRIALFVSLVSWIMLSAVLAGRRLEPAVRAKKAGSRT